MCHEKDKLEERTYKHAIVPLGKYWPGQIWGEGEGIEISHIWFISVVGRK